MEKQRNQLVFDRISSHTGINVSSPISGQVGKITCPLILQNGVGVEIKPTNNKVFAPFSGQIVKIDPAIGLVVLQAKNKLKLAIQLPFSFVQHNGLGLKLMVKLGQKVNVHDTLMTLNLFKLTTQVSHLVLNVYWLNAQAFKNVIVPCTHVESGADPLFILIAN